MPDLHWDTTTFLSLYSAIQEGEEALELLRLVKDDLLNLLVVKGPNTISRKALESRKITSTTNGQKYELNDDFVLSSIELSSEFKIDELVAAELLLNVKGYQEDQNLTTSILDTARIAYYKRIETILYILNYYINTGSLDELKYLFGDDLKVKRILQDNILKSFAQIEAELDSIHESRKELKILQPTFIPTVDFKTKVNFRRSNLFKFHQLLGQIFYSISSSPVNFIEAGSNEFFKNCLQNFTQNLMSDDSFLLNYLPGLYNYVITITKKQKYNNNVIELFEFFSSQLTSKNIEATLLKNPAKSSIVFFFYCFMSEWLQGEWFSPSEQQSNFDKYFDNIQLSILKLIKIGSFEQLMVIAGEIFSSTISSAVSNHSQFYDMQLLLQKHIPKLIPKRLLDIDEEKTKQLHELINSSRSNNLLHSDHTSAEYPKIYLESLLSLQYDSNLKLIFHSIFDDLLKLFLNNFSNILIRICDAEEDFYLTNIRNSNNNVSMTIDDLAEQADLERFYMIMFYNFSNRKTPIFDRLNDDSVDTDESNFIEFLEWGLSKTTNTLIKSCFTMLLSGLAEGEGSGVQIYELMSDSVTAANGGNIEDGGVGSKLLLLDGGISSLGGSKRSSSNVLSGSNNSDTKLSWSTIFKKLKDHNEDFKKKYEEFVSKFQNSYNELFLPSSSLNSIFPGKSQVTVGLNASSNTNDHKKEKKDLKLEDLELSEEELIELSSYFKLIYSTTLSNPGAQNLFYEKNSFELLDILFEFLNNLTNVASLKNTFSSGEMSRSSQKASDGKNSELKGESFLIGLILSVIKALVPTSNLNHNTMKIKQKIWNKLDEWLFTNKLCGVSNRNIRNPSFKNFFNSIFLEFSDVFGFLSLFEVLICVGAEVNDNADEFYVGNNVDGQKFPLPYPVNLGVNYRKSGVWPYMDYFLNDIFTYLTSENFDTHRKNALLKIILNIMLACFKYFNPMLILLLSAANLDNDSLNSIVESDGDFVQYLRENPATIVMNYCYTDKVRDILFNCVSIGNDEISDKSASDLNVQIVKLSLGILYRILKFENTYIDIIVPAITREVLNSQTKTLSGSAVTDIRSLFFLPGDVGTHGLKTFYNALSFNLPSIGHLGLYVGSNFFEISSTSIELLNQISKSSQFLVPNSLASNNLPLIKRNRLLTIFETIDESARIRMAFVDQFESSYTEVENNKYNDYSENSIDRNLELKIKLLNFLVEALQESGNEMTVAHYLLGFEVSYQKRISLGSFKSIGAIGSSRSLLGSLLTFFENCLEQNAENSENMSYPAIRFASLILKIILQLCKRPLTSSLILVLLDMKYNFYEKLLNFELLVGLDSTRFDGQLFDSDFKNLDNKFVVNSAAIGCLLSFYQSRGELLQYLCLELNRISNNTAGSLMKLDNVIKMLIASSDGSPKVLSFLDTLELNIKTTSAVNDISNGVKFFDNLNLKYIFLDRGIPRADWCLHGTQYKNESFSSIYNLDTLEFILNLKLKKMTRDGVYTSDKTLVDKTLEAKYIKELQAEKEKANQEKPAAANKPLFGYSMAANTNITLNNLPSAFSKESPLFSNQLLVVQEKELIKKLMINAQATHDFKNYQLNCLHSWVQLIQLILLDNKVNNYYTKVEFILSVFETIVPKINSYYDYDINISKEFVSLSLMLFSVYTESVEKVIILEQNKVDGNGNPDMTTLYERLYPVFQTCVRGILNKNLDATLRSDLYALMNKFLLWVLNKGDKGIVSANEVDFVARLIKSIKFSSDKILSAICGDINNGDDSSRVTALILLESLCRLSNIDVSGKLGDKNGSGSLNVNKINFLVNYLVNNNNFLLMLIRSITRTDVLLSLTKDNRSASNGVTLNSLLYELTAFKATLSFLTRVAETKGGSNHLIQLDIFKTLGSLTILSVDPDMGMNIILDQFENDHDGVTIASQNESSRHLSIRLSLDNPLNLRKNISNNNSSSTEISLFELFVPVFQLIAAVLVSVGPSNRKLIENVKCLLIKNNRLFTGIMKREVLLENSELRQDDISVSGLHKLSDLFLLLSSLTNYRGDF